MKKNILALSVATAVVDMVGDRPVLRTIGHGAPVCTPQFGDTGCGHMLLVPYYGSGSPWWRIRAFGERNADQYDFKRLLK